VKFKCVGTIYDHTSQETLAKVSQLHLEDIPVGIFPEPNNKYDAKAICFKCKISEEWIRIGYIVREALDHVHTALQHKKIIRVRFDWVKYLAMWSRPGFYCAINITKNDVWHPDVVKCRSTK
jgi:hypothetical protein